MDTPTPETNEPQFHASGLPQPTWDSLVKANGPKLFYLSKIGPDERILVFRPWRAEEYRAFVGQVADDRSQLATAQEQAFNDTVVYPVGPTRDAMLKEFPALARRVQLELDKLALGEVTREAKKG